MEKAGMKTLIADGENIKHPISTSRISSRAA